MINLIIENMNITESCFFLLLNNNISTILNKPILKIPDWNDQTQCEQISELSATAVISKNYTMIKQNDITIILSIEKSINYNLHNIIQYYLDFGFEYILQLLEGEYAICLFDHRFSCPDSKCYIATDRLGLYPLYILTETTTSERKILGFSNNIRNLQLESDLYTTNYNITKFPPGSYSHYSYSHKVLSFWTPIATTMPYFISWPFYEHRNGAMEIADCYSYIKCIHDEFQYAVEDNIDLIISYQQNLPVKIGCLLSGGIDSSITALMIKNALIRANIPTTELYTFAMGFEGSADLIYAKKMANFLGSTHQEFIINEEDYIAAIPNTIAILETYDIATIRYGAALYLLLEYISKNTDIQHIFSGDGADELMGGYLNFSYIKNAIENDYETKRLLRGFHKKQGLFYKLFKQYNMFLYRPFLHTQFVNSYMSIPLHLRFCSDNILNTPVFFGKDKALLRIAFSGRATGKSEIPSEILWRTVEPGYDGISCYYRPLWKIIVDGLKRKNIPYINALNHADNDLFASIERNYYKDFFRKIFPKCTSLETIHQEECNPPFKYATYQIEPTMRQLDIYLDFMLEYQDRCV